MVQLVPAPVLPTTAMSNVIPVMPITSITHIVRINRIIRAIRAVRTVARARFVRLEGLRPGLWVLGPAARQSLEVLRFNICEGVLAHRGGEDSAAVGTVPYLAPGARGGASGATGGGGCGGRDLPVLVAVTPPAVPAPNPDGLALNGQGLGE